MNELQQVLNEIKTDKIENLKLENLRQRCILIRCRKLGIEEQ